MTLIAREHQVNALIILRFLIKNLLLICVGSLLGVLIALYSSMYSATTTISLSGNGGAESIKTIRKELGINQDGYSVGSLSLIGRAKIFFKDSDNKTVIVQISQDSWHEKQLLADLSSNAKTVQNALLKVMYFSAYQKAIEAISTNYYGSLGRYESLGNKIDRDKAEIKILQKFDREKSAIKNLFLSGNAYSEDASYLLPVDAQIQARLMRIQISQIKRDDLRANLKVLDALLESIENIQSSNQEKLIDYVNNLNEIEALVDESTKQMKFNYDENLHSVFSGLSRDLGVAKEGIKASNSNAFFTEVKRSKGLMITLFSGFFLGFLVSLSLGIILANRNKIADNFRSFIKD